MFGEKSFVIPGNGYRTAIPRTAFRVFVTVVAALFQDWASIAMPSSGPVRAGTSAFAAKFCEFCIHYKESEDSALSPNTILFAAPPLNNT